MKGSYFFFIFLKIHDQLVDENAFKKMTLFHSLAVVEILL